MARFLCTVWPYPGHLYPMLSVARALRARGHEVAFYSAPAARAPVEAEGCAFFPFDALDAYLQQLMGTSPYDVDEDGIGLYDRVLQRYAHAFAGGVVQPIRLMKALYTEWILGSVPRQVADLEAVVSAWRPDMIVTDPTLWAPIMVLNDRGDVPVAVFSFFAGCLVPGPDMPPLGPGLPRPRNWYTRAWSSAMTVGMDLLTLDLKRATNALRRRYGLGAISSVAELSGRMPLYLVAASPEYDYMRRDLPPSVHYVGACLWDAANTQAHAAGTQASTIGARKDATSTQASAAGTQSKGSDALTKAPWLADLAREQPLVYVTEGTVHLRDAALLRAAARGLADLPIQVIMTTGRGRTPATLGLSEVAPNVRVEQFIPHSALFPHLSAVVTNGGSGTVRAALDAGLPLVIAPMEWDQFDNAQRVADAGAGLRLSARRCTPERLRLAVQRILNEPRYRANARALGEASRCCGGPARAAELLEQHASRRLPHAAGS